ncbi:MAG: hypothetical protein ABFD98_03105 [Syntrophobacteraceae bacterium]|nr:methyl-accepting chemotaxis protein [Desulfobacteraceae bacterium]
MRWDESLRNSKEEVDRINAAMERDFLPVGEKLVDFYREAQGISQMASSVAGQVSGDRIAGTMEGLGTILDRVKQLESNTRLGAETLEEILTILDGIHESGTRFHGITRILRVLCITIQIESARFGQDDTGFDTLAGDIRKLGLDIESQFSGILDHSDELGKIIRQTVSRISGTHAGRTDREKLILDNILLTLTSLRERHHISVAAAESLARRYEELSGNIAEIVTSVQFHDITRQRFEHVGKAFEDLIPAAEASQAQGGKRLLPPPAGTAGEETKDPESAGDVRLPSVGRMAAICRLQGQQLDSSRDTLVEAVENIIHNLHAAARNISDMSLEAQQVAGIGSERDSSFLSGLESMLTDVSAVLGEYLAANRRLSEATHSVAKAVSEMAAFVKSIEKIGFEINLIALNAIVKAEHIGERGAALGVLAEAVHALSLDTRSQSDQVSDLFRAVATAAEGIVRKIEEGMDGAGEAEISGDLKVHIATIGEVNGDLLELTSRMEAAGKALSRDMDETASRIVVHRQAADAIGGILAAMGALTAQLELSGSGGDGGDGTDDMEELASMYTMESERAVHHSLTDRPEQAPEDAPAAAAPQLPDAEVPEDPDGKDDEDLGDNVELF